MRIPFTTEQFLDIFRRYNEAVWPLQGLLYALGVAGVVLALRGTPRTGRAVGAILGALWLWTGAAYFLAFFLRAFGTINPFSATFGILFIAQAVLFLWEGAWRGRLTFHPHRDAAGWAGAVLLVYALAVYPALSYALGHRYPAAPTFGLPCPTTILTFGLLLWATAPVPRVLLVVPALWAAVGTVTALQVGMQEDLGLLAAGVVGVAMLLMRGRRGMVGHATAAAPRT